MAQLPFSRQPIELAVSDRLPGAVKQKARFRTLRHTQDASGACTAVIEVLVTMYAATAEGDFGPPLSGAGFSSYTRELSADNTCLVDAATGAILDVQNGRNDAAWQARIDELSQDTDTMLQGDFFQHLRDNGLPGTIRQLIEHHIQQADALGRFQ